MRFPRRRYRRGPTPIEHLRRLSRYLDGPEIYIKRDDLAGLAAGGNKTRKLEFLVADALAHDCDTLVTVGAIQSNHCRLTLAAAAKEGLRCRLLLRRTTPEAYRVNGNALLFDLLGADALIELNVGDDVNEAMTAAKVELEAAGRRPYEIPVGGSNPLGTLGYVVCAQEIIAQCLEENLVFDHIVCATGSGGTHAGLVAGFWMMNASIPIIGVNVSRLGCESEAIVRELAAATLNLLDVDRDLPVDAIRTRDEWLGPRYAEPTEEMNEAVRIFARTEGMLLDPVYTGKAAACLIAIIRAHELQRGASVLFMHTGGAPGLYAYRAALQGRSAKQGV